MSTNDLQAMPQHEKKYLVFGPLTILIEWVGLVVILLLLESGLNLNRPLSLVSQAAFPVPQVFIATLVLAGAAFYQFSKSLRSHSVDIPTIALVSGVAFALTGMVPYSETGNLTDILHNICIYTAVSGYTLMIWRTKGHPVRHIGRASEALFVVMIGSILGAFTGLFIVHKWVAVFQLLILIVAQIWTLLVTIHLASEAR